MDDSEARYLIDQFNKYASWVLRGGELSLVETSMLVAVVALAFAAIALFTPSPTESTLSGGPSITYLGAIVGGIVLVIVSVVFMSAFFGSRTVKNN